MRNSIMVVAAVSILALGICAWVYLSQPPKVLANNPTQSVPGLANRPACEPKEKPPKAEEVKKEPVIPEPVRPVAQEPPPIDALIKSLVDFAAEADLTNCRTLLVELKKRPEQAAAVAKTRFEAEALRESPPKSKLYVLGFLGLLLSEDDSELLFGELRKNWTKASLTPGRAKTWEMTEIMPLDHVAGRGLQEEDDRLLVDVAAFVIRDNAIEGRSLVVKKLLTLSIAPYTVIEGEPKALNETPDPWLSSLLDAMIPQLKGRGVTEDGLKPFNEYCATIQTTRVFSLRLRHQARCMFMEAARDEIAFLAGLSSAATPAEASKVLALYLANLGNANLDWPLVWELFIGKFGLSKAALAMSDGINSAANKYDFERWAKFSKSFLENVLANNLAEDTAYLLNSNLRSIVIASGKCWRLGKNPGAMPAAFKGAALRAHRLCENLVDRQNAVQAKLNDASAGVYAITLATNIIGTGHSFSEMLALLRRHCESVQKWSSAFTAEMLDELYARCATNLVEQAPAAQEFLVYVLDRCKTLDNGRIHKEVVKQMNAKTIVSVNNYAKLLKYSPLTEGARMGLQCLMVAVDKDGSAADDAELVTALRELKTAGYLR